MTGVGGAQYAKGHAANTVAALGQMSLDAGDIVYFSPFFEQPDSEYRRVAAEAGIEPLAAEEIAAQERAIREGLRRHLMSREGPQVSRYNIREFVY
jgi:hypothetical protein